MARGFNPYSCLVDWSCASTSASLSLSFRSSSWLLAKSSWSFFFSVRAFSQALARVFSFCGAQQQEKGTSSVTGTGSECFGSESAGCDRRAPSSQFPVAALTWTLLSPARLVSPAGASARLHKAAWKRRWLTRRITLGQAETSDHCTTSNISFPTHFLLVLLHIFSSLPLDLVDRFKHQGDFPLSGGVIVCRPEKQRKKYVLSVMITKNLFRSHTQQDRNLWEGRRTCSISSYKLSAACSWFEKEKNTSSTSAAHIF